MSENEKKTYPFTLTIIPIFYGIRVLMNLLAAGERYILFSFILPVELSSVVITLETALLLFLTIGLIKRRKVACTLLIGYNIFAIAETLTTLIFIKKEKLLTIIDTSSQLEEFANINLIFCLILFWILRYVMSHKEYFTNK